MGHDPPPCSISATVRFGIELSRQRKSLQMFDSSWLCRLRSGHAAGTVYAIAPISCSHCGGLIDVCALAPAEKQTNSDVIQRLSQIGYQIFDVLDSYRDANQRIGETDLLAQLTRDARMRHRGRMRDQRFSTA
jgi:hypothetical protein